MPQRVKTYTCFRIAVKLSPPENERLQAAARQMGLPDWELARKALRAFGLI